MKNKTLIKFWHQTSQIPHRYFLLLTDYFPDAIQSDKYKLLTLKAYFRFAENSYIDKQKDSFEKVIFEYNDFVDRYRYSPLLDEAKKVIQKSLERSKK